MTAYPIVYQTSTGKIVRKTTSKSVVFKDRTYATNSQATNPRVMLRYSDDGGYTWSNERHAFAGRIGEFKQRVCFNRLGMSSDRVFKITVTDPVKWILIDASVEVEKAV